MGPVTYMIAILGCADGSATCQQVALMPARYESRASCAAATNEALVAGASFDFPTVVAECRVTKAPAAAKRDLPKRDIRIATREG